MGFGYNETCGTNSHNDYMHVTAENPEEDRALVRNALEVLTTEALRRLDGFKAQGQSRSGENNVYYSFGGWTWEDSCKCLGEESVPSGFSA